MSYSSELQSTEPTKAFRSGRPANTTSGSVINSAGSNIHACTSQILNIADRVRMLGDQVMSPTDTVHPETPPISDTCSLQEAIRRLEHAINLLEAEVGRFF